MAMIQGTNDYPQQKLLACAMSEKKLFNKLHYNSNGLEITFMVRRPRSVWLTSCTKDKNHITGWPANYRNTNQQLLTNRHLVVDSYFKKYLTYIYLI